jgi:hypothetical protein
MTETGRDVGVNVSLDVVHRRHFGRGCADDRVYLMQKGSVKRREALYPAGQSF